MLEFRAPKFIRRLFKIYAKASEDYIEELGSKHKSLHSNAESIKFLALGSSHGAYGFNPDIDKSFFNLCSTSQDLYYSYNLYEYCCNHLKNLDSVLLFYSVFSPGFELQKTIDSHICAYIKLIFGINYKDEDKQKLKFYLDDAKWVLKKSKQIKDCSQGYTPSFRFLTDYPLEKRISTHLRENKRENQQHDYLEKIIELTRKNEHKLYIIIPPCRSDYRENMPSSDELFKKLHDLTSKTNIKIFNFYKDKEFVWDDFGDFDHLNKMGADKLSKKIYEKLINQKVTS